MESIHVKWIIVFAILVSSCLIVYPKSSVLGDGSVFVKRLRLEGSPKLNLDHLSGKDKT